MSAKKKVNQSSPRSLATGERDCAAVCPGEADGERMGSARRAKRPAANSKASVDRPNTPAPQGTDGVVYRPSAPRIGHPSISRHLSGTFLCEAVPVFSIGLSMRKDGNFEKSCSNPTAFHNELGSWYFDVGNRGTLRCSAPRKVPPAIPEVLGLS